MRLLYSSSCLGLLGMVCVQVPPLEEQEPKQPAVVATVSGRVLLDTNGTGKSDAGDRGLANVLVSDGIQFVRTAADGSYSLTFADDPLLPYRPAQVLTVCWPSGTWPVARQFFARRSEMRPGQPVDFLLREQQQTLPFTFAHGSDPHDNTCGGELFAADVGRLGDGVKFCLMTGDLGYAVREGAEKMFTSLRAATLRFPIPLLHAPGNHDICDIHTPRWSEQDPLAGYGPYTKYLGPIRYSFDYAGVHFVALDWARIVEEGKLQTGVPDTVIAWLKKDLAHLKPGTRTFVFMHHDFRHGDDTFWDVLVAHKVERVIAGHSHRNKEETRRSIPRLTTQNLCGPYRLLTVHDKGHDIVNRCFTGTATGHTHSYAGQCKMAFDFKTFAAKRGPRMEASALEVKGTHALEGFAAREFELIADIDPGSAKRLGVRFGAGDAKGEVALTEGDVFQLGAIQSPAVRGRGEKQFRLWLVVAGGKLLVQANNRVQYEKAFSLPQEAALELFAESGPAVFKKVEAWPLKGEK